MATSCCGKFVSQKISKIRWKPVSSNACQKPDIFITGSWQSEINKISVWQNWPVRDAAESGDPSNLLAETDPKFLCDVPHTGDVTDLKFLTPDTLAASSSNGSVSLYKQVQAQEPRLQMIWEHVHHFLVNPAPCTGLDSHGENIVSVGEDGRVVHYNAKRNKPIQIIDADSCVLTAVVYLKLNEVIVSNTQGQLSLWDLRSPVAPAKQLLTTGEETAIISMNRHPTEPSILACGSEGGTICFWDLRQEKYPTTILTAHDGPVLEVKFHPISPNHLFTSSMDGMIWHWDCEALASSLSSSHLKTKSTARESSNPWLSCGASKHQIEIYSLIPSSNKSINSLDILEDVLICGSDNEAIYVVSNLQI